RRAARTVPPPPADEMASVMNGQSLFMMCCASSLAQSRLQAVVAAEARFMRDDFTHPTGNSCPLTAGGCCANCLRMSCPSGHAAGGRVPTAVGRSLYPRAPALDSPEVQSYTDAELFWIIKYGIRLTGMPGWGEIYSDQEIWHLARFVRSVGAQPSP